MRQGVHVFAATIAKTDHMILCTELVWRMFLCPVDCQCDADRNSLDDPNCVSCVSSADTDDGDVDLAGIDSFATCRSAPGVVPGDASCCSVDFDNDGDLDLRDWGTFQAAFTGWLFPGSGPRKFPAATFGTGWDITLASGSR